MASSFFSIPINKVTFLLTFLFIGHLKSQERYLGGNLTMMHNSVKANAGFQNQTTSNTSVQLSPEFGIINEKGDMFGLNVGFFFSRNSVSGSGNTLLGGILGIKYRKLFGDKTLRPLFSTGIVTYIGQNNPSSQGSEYFRAQIPISVGLMYEFKSNWSVIGAVDVFGFNYERTNGSSLRNVYLLNNSALTFTLIRHLR